MGIRSLTTYLENRSGQFLESYKLHDCNLIIDGSSLCFNLYNWNYSFWHAGCSYDCYGGDYDKFAEIVKGFFEMLQICNVDYYILFGGRNGFDRVPIIKKRLEEKMIAASEIIPNNLEYMKGSLKWHQHKSQAGLVALKCAFRDVLTELNLKTFSCAEDPNREIACLAKELKCPVLSANSDFFVLGSMFIPFSSINCEIQTNSSNWRNANKKLDYFIPCRIYRIENLLSALNKRPDNNFIPYLVPILLGCDYVNPEIFEPFFKSLRIVGPRQKKIAGIFEWLKRQNSLEMALKNILHSFNNEEERNVTSKLINRAIMGYSPISITSLLEYFHVKPMDKSTKYKLGMSDTLDPEMTNPKINPTGLELFLKRIKECRYPSFFMDMLKENRYFLQANIEDCTKLDANSIGYTIMAAIHNILVQNDENRLTVFRRTSDLTLEEYILPELITPLPSIEEIDYLRLESRLDILLKTLEVDENFCQMFEGLPKEWHLFLLSLKYTTTKSQLDSTFIYSLILCFIVLNYVDSHLKSFCRTYKDLLDISVTEHNNSASSCAPSKESGGFPKISTNDSVICMQIFIKYFEMDANDNNKTFDRGIMHSIAEFQCVFLHLKHLNNLLDFTIPDTVIYKIFDNTFIYKMTEHLRNASSPKDYLINLLQDCLTIRSGFSYVTELLVSQDIL